MSAWARGLLLCCLLCSSAQAKVECPALFDREGSRDTYYVLVLLEPVTGADQAGREQERERLMSAFTPQLSGIALKLKERSGSKRRLRLELVACEHHLRGTDLAREEMKELTKSKVIAVFWKGQEGDKAGLVQLAVPVYLRSDGALRQDAEVVTVYATKAVNPIDGWMEVLAQNDGELYRPFVSMGLASVYQRENEFAPAWMALCDSRSGLALLVPSTLRPTLETLASEIVTPLAEVMKELEKSAQKLGAPAMPTCSIAALKATP